MSEVFNFADDNTLDKLNNELVAVFKILEIDLDNSLSWFRINSLKVH